MTRHVYYPGFCDKHGLGRVVPAAAFAPLAPQAAVALLTGGPAALPVCLYLGFMSGMIGFIFGVFAHELGNVHAARTGRGLTRGGALVRAWQGAAYALPVVVGLAAGLVLAHEKALDTNEKSAVDAPLPASPPAGSAYSLAPR